MIYEKDYVPERNPLIFIVPIRNVLFPLIKVGIKSSHMVEHVGSSNERSNVIAVYASYECVRI